MADEEKTSGASVIANRISGKTRKQMIDEAVDTAAAGREADKVKRQAQDEAAANGNGRTAPNIKWSKLK